MNYKLLLAFAAFVFIGCKKDPLKGKYFGAASATLNDKVWKAGKVMCNIVPCYKGKLGFIFLVYNKQGFLREKLSFKKIPIAKGNYYLNSENFRDPVCNDTVATATYSTVQDHGDVSLDSYNAIPSSNNYFTIESYNERTKRTAGQLCCKF